MRALLLRLIKRREVAILAFALGAIAIALVLGRWLAVIQEPPTRHSVARQLLDSNAPADAAHLFEEPIWQGVALYRAGRYHRAVGAFVTDDSITGLYNMGNAYAQLGLYEGAIAAYEVVLNRMPGHEDARHNLELVRAAAQRERELEDESRETTEAGNWEDGLIQEEQKTEGTTEPAAENEDGEQPETSESQSEEQGDGSRTETSQAPPSSNGASGSDQSGDLSEAATFTLTGSEEENDDSLSPTSDELSDRPVTSGKIDRQREEAMADEIVLRRIEDNPALVLKARLAMALRKQKAGR
ncbi:MAG: tetratricopeptide repeat protein [Geminicoccaceae bacterium]